MEGNVPDITDFSLTYGDITSPSQLQEVTLDQDVTFSNSMGLRSPGGPMRGRSVKEFEEQLANLKKENFNLKLRIYFLEERMGTNFNLDKENVVKKNVELMVEVESLRKEVQEKHDLLCQAVKAMELEDEEHKKIVNEKDEMLNEYKQEIENFKAQLCDINHDIPSGTLSPKSYQSVPADILSSQAFNLQDSTDALKELQEKINSLEEELNQEKENSAAIQMVMDQSEAKIKNLSAQLEEVSKKLLSREDELKNMNFQLTETQNKYLGIQKKLQQKGQLIDEVKSENEELRKRYSGLVADMEKERKRYEKLKLSSEQKSSELQCKLEASLAELKKSQELVVSKSPARRPGNTDADSFSVQKPATSPRSPQKDPNVFSTVVSPVVTPVASPSPSINIENPVDLKCVIEQLKSERDAQHQKIVKLKAEQMKACKIIKSMIDSRNKTNDEITMLKQKNEQLEQELEGVVSQQKAGGSDKRMEPTTSSLFNENSMDEQSGELFEHYKALTEELEEKNKVLVATLNEKDNQLKRLQEEFEEILNDYKQKEEQIVDLEFELLTLNGEGKNSRVDGENTPKEIENYIKQLREKDEEIERLNESLQKRNNDLQGIVNNELWEKNREIEKLQKKQVSNLIENKNLEISKLQNDLKVKESQLEIIKEKISELGIDIDLQSGDVNIENNLQNELEKSEKLRLEANEVCAVLSNRLEELAIFLDSLLKQKSVLGFLGNKENKRLREIIDQSLSLSRSFTVSMIIDPEQSLMQLTNISSLLNDTKTKVDDDISPSRLSIMPANASLTYRSHLYKKNDDDSAQIIQALREQIVNLKYELQVRDVELNKLNGEGGDYTEGSSVKDEDAAQKSTLNTTSTTLKYKSDNQSESEAWSEPDRSVSRARIGLAEGGSFKSIKKAVSCTSTDSTEEEETERSIRSTSKKGILNESRHTIIELHTQVCELEEKLTNKEKAHHEIVKDNNKLKQDLENLEIQLKDSEVKLTEAENKKIEAEISVENLQKEKDELLERLIVKDKELENKINQIEIERNEALSVAKEAEEAAEMARNEMKLAEVKLRTMQQQMIDLEITLRNEYENQLQIFEIDSMKKMKQIQNEAEIEIDTLRQNIEKLQAEYSNNYVKKCEIEDAVEEIDRLKTEIETLEKRIEELSGEEQGAKNKLNDYEEKINILRNDLDNATLQYSEAVLEKTKMANEKAIVEQEFNRSVLREVDLKKRLDEVENELSGLRQNYQKQISLLQMQKSKLEVRISELESSNAELHNRLIKIQAGCGDHVSSSLPNTPNFVNQIVSFRRQHSDNSDYVSDYMLEDVRSGNIRSFNRLMPPSHNIDIERHEANSSPDLGIESDHGRFSSLETHLNVQRPLLQTLELTESMNNLLDGENNPVESVSCDDVHCCQKTLEMAHENTDLKRKLLRTRRALEETVTQLTLANQRKKQVEKTICKQIHKTSQVLRKAKANLDSGSETDVLYKK